MMFFIASGFSTSTLVNREVNVCRRTALHHRIYAEQRFPPPAAPFLLHAYVSFRNQAVRCTFYFNYGVWINAVVVPLPLLPCRRCVGRPSVPTFRLRSIAKVVLP